MNSSTLKQRQRGYTLPEILVSLTIFIVILLATYMLYSRAQESYTQADVMTGQQQDVRFVYDRVAQSIRNAGLRINPTADKTLTDEQIEGVWEAAIFMRSDYDGARETSLENTGTGGHAYVTTGNDEIIGFGLEKTGANSQSVTIIADLTGTSDKRDSIFNNSGVPVNEESRTISLAATTLAQQTAPPYTLYRYSFDTSGNLTKQVVAENVFQFRLSYLDDDGAALTPPGGANGTNNADRDVRADIRSVQLEIIGMSGRHFYNYVDPQTYSPDPASAKAYRKFRIASQIRMPNIGAEGADHGPVPPITIQATTAVTACGGHCGRIVVSWPAVTGVTDYVIQASSTSPVWSQYFDALGVTTKVVSVPSPTATYTLTVKSYDAASNTLSSTGPSITFTPTHDTTNNRPQPVTAALTTAQNGTDNAIRVEWTAPTLNVNPIAGNTCTTSPGGAPSAIGSAYAQALIDIGTYAVYRAAADSSTPNFTPTASHRVDTKAGNTTPGDSSSFIDNTAAPCVSYYYKVRPVDQCSLEATSDSPAMGSGVSYTPASLPTPGDVSGLGAISPTDPGLGTYDIPLTWSEVSTPLTAAKYVIQRERSVGAAPFAADAMINVDGTSYTDTPVAKVGGVTATYRYSVKARYSCSTNTDSANWSNAYVFPCTATGTAAISTPTAGQQITDTVSPAVTVTGTWTSAQIQIRKNFGDYAVVYPASGGLQSSNNSNVTGGSFTFPVWDTDPGFTDGEYVISGLATQGSCVTTLAPVTFQLTSVTCGLTRQATSLVNSDKTRRFTLANAASPCTNGVVRKFSIDWTGSSSNYLKKIFYGGTDLYDPGSSVAAGEPSYGSSGFNNSGAAKTAAFNKPGTTRTFTVNAGATSSNIDMEFDQTLTGIVFTIEIVFDDGTSQTITVP